MKIKKMTASFGCLEGRSLELGEGLNILYAPNESGKSTWCAFLRTMLYGMTHLENKTVDLSGSLDLIEACIAQQSAQYPVITS